jgi:glutathione S-transferase
MSQPYLFYSTRSPSSMRVIAALKALNKIQLVKAVSIDGMTRDKLPPFLKGVPTLYIPDTKDIYEGEAINAYLAKPVTPRKEVPVAGSAQGTPQQQNNAFGEYSFEGKNKMSDSFSDWTAPNQFSQDQSKYTFITEMNTPPPTADPRYSNDDKANIGDRLKELEAQREKEFAPAAKKQ